MPAQRAPAAAHARPEDGEYRALLRLAALVRAGPPPRTPLDALQQLVDLARELTRARYAALAVCDENDRTEGFVTSGLTRAQLRGLKVPPQGHGPLGRLRTDVDLWVASASADGQAYLVPLSYHWDGSALLVATPRASRTAENLTRTGWARVALGPTRDVVIVEGPVEAITIGADPDLEDAHALAAGFDPRTLAEEYVYLRITPHEIQAWREANELEGRYVMRGGAWLE